MPFGINVIKICYSDVMLLQIKQTENGYQFTKESGEYIRDDEQCIGYVLSTLADAIKEKEEGRYGRYATFLSSAAEELRKAANYADADYREIQKLAGLPNRKMLYAASKGMGTLGAELEEKIRRHESMCRDISENEEFAAELNRKLMKLKEKFEVQTPVQEHSKMHSALVDFKDSISSLIAPGLIGDLRSMLVTFDIFLELLPSSKFCLKKAGEEIERD